MNNKLNNIHIKLLIIILLKLLKEDLINNYTYIIFYGIKHLLLILIKLS